MINLKLFNSDRVSDDKWLLLRSILEKYIEKLPSDEENVKALLFIYLRINSDEIRKHGIYEALRYMAIEIHDVDKELYFHLEKLRAMVKDQLVSQVKLVDEVIYEDEDGINV